MNGQRAVLILAAGGSTRMGAGRDKLLEPVNGQPLLADMIGRVRDVATYVCLPGPDHPRAACLPDGAVPVGVPDAAEGMGASIRTGVQALPATVTDLMILPADMPDLTAADLSAVWRAHEPGAITRGASAAGVPGHPVIFPHDLLRELLELRGDEGARSVLVRHRQRVRLVPLPHDHALTDLDTPEAWAAWRARQD
ncbi:nucleotidyltransferase family protein [Thalassovita sp.]|uniref:nucleotidyltransferase family protein n=1 Tax=Thalassovita sp. TaxID=1979401 RepID=UPI0029DE6A88|nr:nucleotidyltransferase family protein [Thalassovita sp.]